MQLNLFMIEEAIVEIDQNAFDTSQNIISESNYEAKRARVIDWIIKEKITILIAFSGGKDSIAMALYLAFELKVPISQIELWHHEVDGRGEALFDWPCTKSYCQAFANAFGFKLLFSYRDGGILREIYRKDENIQGIYFQDIAEGPFHFLPSEQSDRNKSTRLKFPAVSADLQTRWCSSTVKIMVMSRVINNMDRFKEASLLICTGERRAESVARSKYNEIEPYRSYTKSRKALLWRPLIDWTDREIWAILEKYKVQPHPAYELGWSRCSCQLCIFNSANAWASLFEIEQNKINRISEIEVGTGFTLYKDQSILDKTRSGKSFLTPEQIKRWATEANSLFSSPIIVSNWMLPPGAKSLERTGAL